MITKYYINKCVEEYTRGNNINLRGALRYLDEHFGIVSTYMVERCSVYSIVWAYLFFGGYI